MEFQEVVRRRRMVRRYDDRPVDAAVLDRMLANAVRAPSAGFSQGWGFLVLDRPDDVARFWSATTGPDDGEPDQPFETPRALRDGLVPRPPQDIASAPQDKWLRGMRTAPVVIVPLSHKAAYLSRYAESDKGWADKDESRWPVPYWDIDTGMASLLILQTAVDEGLGACFFGVPPDRTDAFRAEFGVPPDYTPVGAITVGHRHPEDLGPAGSAATRSRRTPDEVVHRGHW